MAGPGPQDAPRWQRCFSAMVVVSDLATIAVVVTVCVLVGMPGFEAGGRARIASGLLAAALMVVALPLARAWDGRVLGQGSTEFVRLGRAVILADVTLAFGGLALMVQSTREWVFLLVPVTGLASEPTPTCTHRSRSSMWPFHSRRTVFSRSYVFGKRQL